MRFPIPLAAAALLAGGAFVARASDAMRTAPRAPPGPASMLGGFTALAVQVLWMRADQAVIDLREDDAQLAFATIAELEPQLVSSSDYIARALGFDLAEGHRDPAARWALGREGWRVLCRTVERNPGEARAYEARGRYALLRMHHDPSMRAGFVRDVDPAGPLEWARRDYEEALRLRPQWNELWNGVGMSSMGRAKQVYEQGDVTRAAALYRRAAEAFAHVTASLAGETAGSVVEFRDNAERAAAFAAAMADVCGLPPAERAARIAELRRVFGVAEDWLPAK
jgi:hypothetical protein